jgi:formylglycine-generating enzyme required for sulfatase activity
MNSLDLLVSTEVGKATRVAGSLIPSGNETSTMVQIPAGVSPLAPNGSRVEAFLIDRFETTNEQFLKFVTAGGYRQQKYWPETLQVDGRPTPWASAIDKFVDRTNLPGPRDWSNGRFPDGKANHPVVGVSWYEADAYAKWSGKELPSPDQWWRAALGDGGRVFPWGNDARTSELRANFGVQGTQPVGSYLLGVSPFGCYDMAGNVREWLRDGPATAAKHAVVGGSWQDPAYMFEPGHIETFAASYAGDAIGLRLVMATKGK